MPYIQPLSDVNPHDVINFFKADNLSIGTTGVLPRGTFVKILSGYVSDQQNLAFAGSPGASAGAVFARTVSQRYSVPASVTPVTASGDAVVGMTLYDVREADENGELLIYHPDKAAAMNAVYSGQAVPLAIAGIFLYSGIVGTPTGGAAAYVDGPTQGLNAGGASATRVGTFLGPKDGKGQALVRINII